MSDDDLEKLALGMQNIKPSGAARARGMEAAMAAFDEEFAVQKENISAPAQGLTAEARPMKQGTVNRSVPSQGSQVMSKLKDILTFKPQARLMMGSCMAAFFAAVVFLPIYTQDNSKFTPPSSQAVDKLDTAQNSQDAPAPLSEPELTDEVMATETKKIASPAPETPPRRPAAQTPDKAQNLEVFRAPSLQSQMPQFMPQQDTLAQVKRAQAAGAESAAQSPAPKAQGGIASDNQFSSQTRVNSAMTVPPPPPIIERQQGRTSSLALEARTKPSQPIASLEGATPQFEDYESNPAILVSEKPVSTFSVDVDTASYSFLRASVNRGQLPARGSIRLEELINYFPYDYEAPKSADQPFKANVSVTPTPWNADTKLMHIGIKGYVPPAEVRPQNNLVFLIDTSGSMRAQNKLPLLISSFKLLLDKLDEDDTVSIVTYASSAGTVLEPTLASDKAAIKAALERLRAGGSTAGAAGLELAYEKAQRNFDEHSNNRIIMASDGDFNVGYSSIDEMKAFIKRKRDKGVFLSVLGFGNGNYNDQLMQSLAQNGNGVAAYIDTLSEANKVLARAAGHAEATIAKDVKIQVEFNPDTIQEYRLIGYETRALKRQDFNNDKVDAGEIGAGHTVTAIYELTPIGVSAVTQDPLRYVEERLSATGSNELAFVKIRHKLPDAKTSTLQTFPVKPRHERSLQRAGSDMRFAAAVAAAGQKLRGDAQLQEYSYEDIIKMAKGAKGEDEEGYRAEFITLLELIKGLQK